MRIDFELAECGGGIALAYNDDGAGARTLFGVLGSGYTISDKKATIMGMPLSLYEDSGQYALGIIIDSSIVSTTEEITFNGIPMTLRKSEGNYILHLNQQSGAVSSEVLWYGVPMGVTSDRQLVFAQHTPSGSPDATSEVILFGMPIKCERYGDNWFLVASTS
jgi:hypothetical protein